jgi:hypothetical protein
MNSIGGIVVNGIGVRQVIRRKRGWLSRKTRMILVNPRFPRGAAGVSPGCSLPVRHSPIQLQPLHYHGTAQLLSTAHSSFCTGAEVQKYRSAAVEYLRLGR